MKFSRSRQGFTLVELLVVIAIIGTLVSLLLPAVQQARESARRMSCGNNIRQLALSLQMYHDTHNAFPISHGGNQTYNTTCTGRSWMIGILPFIEKNAIYDQIDKDGFTDLRTGSQNEWASQQIVKTFMCPSDGLNQGGAMDGRANVGGVRGITNYKAVAGANWGYSSFAGNNNGNLTAKWTNDANGLDHGNGLICRNAAVPNGERGNFTTMASVLDGTSNTFAIGEAVPAYCTHSWWWWFNGTTATCSVPVNFRRNQGPAFMATNAGDWGNNYSFMSMHPAGAQFAFVDGHVSFIANSVDLNVYRGAATISGGETTSVQ